MSLGKLEDDFRKGTGDHGLFIPFLARRRWDTVFFFFSLWPRRKILFCAIGLCSPDTARLADFTCLCEATSTMVLSFVYFASCGVRLFAVSVLFFVFSGTKIYGEHHTPRCVEIGDGK